MSHDLVGRELVDEDGGNVLATPDRGTLQLKLLAGAQLDSAGANWNDQYGSTEGMLHD